MYVDEFIAGFHAILDKIPMFYMNDDLKRHHSLELPIVDSHDRNIVFGLAGNIQSLQMLRTSSRKRLQR